MDDEDEEAAIRAAHARRARPGCTVTSDIDRLTNRTGDLVAAVSIPMFNEHALPASSPASPTFDRALTKLRPVAHRHAVRHARARAAR